MPGKLFAVALASALPLAACAPSYTYQPAANATASVAHHTAADYQIPAQAPQGDVRLASFGFTRFAPSNAAPNVTERALHVRMVVANNSTAPWTIDTSKQVIEVPSVGKIAPTFVASREGGAPTPQIVVGPGGKRTIDLFYRLPPGMDKAKNVTGFDELWQVQMPQQTVVERTPFERLRVEPAYAYGYGPYDFYDLGWGPSWYPYDVGMGPPSWYW